MSNSSNKQILGIAGVHFVVAILSRLGYVALPTVRNLKAFDIVAFKDEQSTPIYIQVKTTDKAKGEFPIIGISSKATFENWKDEILSKISDALNVFYVFVAIPANQGEMPSFYIVPSKIVQLAMIKQMDEYLLKRDTRKPSNVLLVWARRGINKKEKNDYLNKWELLSQKPMGNNLNKD